VLRDAGKTINSSLKQNIEFGNRNTKAIDANFSTE
jgi:hypothetical protein